MRLSECVECSERPGCLQSCNLSHRPQLPIHYNVRHVHIGQISFMLSHRHTAVSESVDGLVTAVYLDTLLRRCDCASEALESVTTRNDCCAGITSEYNDWGYMSGTPYF